MITTQKFCSSWVYLRGKPISFADRPYLAAVYAANHRNVVLRCSRQVEKSTFLANTILYEVCRNPGIQILFVSPREAQVRLFSHTRLLDCVDQSPVLRRYLFGPRGRRPQIKNIHFHNGAWVYMRPAFLTADSCRGISADLLVVDEFQDIAHGHLPVLQETLSHAPHPRTILTGTPKMVDNHLEAVFRQSTANEWTIRCAQCGHDVILDERCLGPTGLICVTCGGPIDSRQGRWVARHPNATWGAGYWINHCQVPWINYQDILERQRSYDGARFTNEVLGLPTTTGDHIVTRAELEACCSKLPMAKSFAEIPGLGKPRLVAGLDWGGGGLRGTSRTVLVLGFVDGKNHFHVCRFERFAATEEPDRILSAVAERCREFHVQIIAADGCGNGHVFNRLLLDKLGRTAALWAVQYGASDQPPWNDGVLHRWAVNRSATIGHLCSCIKKRLIIFPAAAECGSFLDEFACETSEYDDINRTVKYTHPESQPDDALHATNYSLLVAHRVFQP